MTKIQFYFLIFLCIIIFIIFTNQISILEDQIIWPYPKSFERQQTIKKQEVCFKQIQTKYTLHTLKMQF
jgi:hypothetical protein